MTDDKGAGEGPYDHIDAASGDWCVFNCPKCAYDAGRKAERERCAEISSGASKRHKWICTAGEEIAKEIRGRQDGE